MTDALDHARLRLRERQGAGARYDADAAPARDLNLARRGTAYFARLLNDLPDEALDEPSALASFSRRRLIAYVGYHARMLSEIIAWGRSHSALTLPREASVLNVDLDFGLVQPSRALRHLFEHTAVHLNVEWRDMSDQDWKRNVCDVGGEIIPLRQTALDRARVIWSASLKLRCGARKADVPPEFCQAELMTR